MKQTENKNVEKNNKDLNNNNEIKHISILNYIDNPFLKKKIQSPRSLKSMKNLGYKMDDIIFMTFPEFLEKYKEIKKLPEEIQNNKYEFYENSRQIKIKNVKIERDNIIQESGGIPIQVDKYLNNERKKVMKELKNTEKELKKEFLIKPENEYDKQEKILERKKRREEKEIERKKKLEEENLKRIKQAEEYEKKEAMKEKLKLEEKAKKEKELKIKRQKFEEKVEKIHKDFNDKIFNKMKIMEEREKERKIKNDIKKQKDMELIKRIKKSKNSRKK